MIKNYLRIAWRGLIKNKMFSCINVTGLAIGVVVCLLIGVWLQRELSYDNFHRSSGDIFRLANTFTSESETFSQAPSATGLGAQLPGQLPSIKTACRVFNFKYKFSEGNNQFFEPDTYIVDSNFFGFFGFHLTQGQPSLVLNTPDKLVLSEKMAIKYFGTVQGVIGKTIMMDNHPMTVGGIAENPPLNSHLQYAILVPYTYLRNWAIQNWKNDLDNVWVGGWPFTYVKLADPAKWKEAEQQVNRVIAKFAEKDWKENKFSYHYFFQPIADIHLKSHLRYDAANNGSVAAVNIFTIVCIIVLLLACINYINLTTAGAIRRAKETSVRKVIGATKAQLLQQFFSETFFICAIAVVLGVAIFKAILPAFSTFMGQPYYFALTVSNMSIILVFIIFLAAIAGIYPAAFLSSVNPVSTLKGNFSSGKTGGIIKRSLVVFQFTITIALMASILIINRQMNFVKNKSLGFNSNAVLEINFNGDQNVVKRYSAIRNELIKNPYIINVSRHDANIVGGLGNGWTKTENLQGSEISTSVYRLNVDADYFNTYSMKLAAGRFFSTTNPGDSANSVLVNESAIKTFGWLTPENAIGKPFGNGAKKKYVVGVVRDFNFESLHKPVEALLIGYDYGGSSLSIKVNGSHITEAISHLTKAWKEMVPEVPLQYSFVDEKIGEQYGNDQKMESIFYGFSGLSLFIACLGLFGLSAFVVELKLKEIGIRKVLGAGIPGIVGLLSKEFLKLVVLSIVIATPLAWYSMNKWLGDFAYRISINWWVFVVAAIAALSIAFVTISFKTIKAAIANPLKSLRSE